MHEAQLIAIYVSMQLVAKPLVVPNKLNARLLCTVLLLMPQGCTAWGHNTPIQSSAVATIHLTDCFVNRKITLTALPTKDGAGIALLISH